MEKGFSVLMSIYAGERADRFALALQSLCNQTMEANEVVLVVDGKIGAALQSVIDYYKQIMPMKTVFLTANVGLPAALNEGLKVCSFPLVARMDTDDVSLPYRFEIQMDFMNKNKEVDIVGSWAIDVDELGEEKGIRRVPLTHDDIRKLIWTCPFIHPSVMYRREKVIDIGSYSLAAVRGEDYDLWFRAMKAGLVFSNISKPLIKYTVNKPRSWAFSLRQGWYRTKTGWKGCYHNGLSILAYVGVSAFMIRGAIPPFLQKYWKVFSSALDPRIKSGL